MTLVVGIWNFLLTLKLTLELSLLFFNEFLTDVKLAFLKFGSHFDVILEQET